MAGSYIVNSLDIMVLADLDDTLFSTKRKIPAEQFESSIAVTQASNGRHSYMTPRHRQLHGWIDAQRLIPVTARGTDSYASVESWICSGPYSILANGATVLDHQGHIVEAWNAVINAALKPHRALLLQLPGLIADAAKAMNLDVRVWNVEEPACAEAYTVVKSNLADDGACLRSVESRVLELLGKNSQWRIHRNGNNLAILPPGLSKVSAAGFVIEQLCARGDYLFVGVGDSVSDLDFMQICDFWMTPSASQISDLGARLAKKRTTP